MKIHIFAHEGDLEGIKQELSRGVSLEAHNRRGITPLMVASASDLVTPERFQAIIQMGANIHELADKRCFMMQFNPTGESEIDESTYKPEDDEREDYERSELPIYSVLAYAVEHSTLEKIDLLLLAKAENRSNYSLLSTAVWRKDPLPQRMKLIGKLLDEGANLNNKPQLFENALFEASRKGEYDLIRFLIDRGADPAVLKWSDLFFATAFGSLERLKSRPIDREAIAQRDHLNRTPLLVAAQRGSLEHVRYLADAGSDLNSCDQTNNLFDYALIHQDMEMLQFLIDRGADFERTEVRHQSPLNRAVYDKNVEAVEILLKAGANPNQQVMKCASHREIISLLLKHGGDLNQLDSHGRRSLLGYDEDTASDFEAYLRHEHQRRFGRANPERMNNPFREMMVRTGTDPEKIVDQTSLKNIHREVVHVNDEGMPIYPKYVYEPNNSLPLWSYQRNEQSFTKLPDGRYVEIAGGTADCDDLDSSIFNDVVVYHPDGSLDIFGYPTSVFPAIAGHTATLVGNSIYIIDNWELQSHPTHTIPIYRISTDTFAVERIECSGEWAQWRRFKHHARLLTDRVIEITQGRFWYSLDHIPSNPSNPEVYHLDLVTRVWSRVN